MLHRIIFLEKKWIDDRTYYSSRRYNRNPPNSSNRLKQQCDNRRFSFDDMDNDKKNQNISIQQILGSSVRNNIVNVVDEFRCNITSGRTQNMISLLTSVEPCHVQTTAQLLTHILNPNV